MTSNASNANPTDAELIAPNGPMIIRPLNDGDIEHLLSAHATVFKTTDGGFYAVCCCGEHSDEIYDHAMQAQAWWRKHWTARPICKGWNA